MIDLTPLEVRHKKGDFRRAFRGYDAELVNDFLDLAADRMEELVKENMALSESLERTGAELAAFREKERMLSDALLAAERLRGEARSNADREAELIVREARAAAEAARQESARKLAAEEDALRQVRARRAQLVRSFHNLLERGLSELNVIEDALELRFEEREPLMLSGGPLSDEEGGGSPDATAPSSPEAEVPDGGAADGAMADEADVAASSGEGAGEEGEASREVGEADGGDDWLSSLVEEQRTE